jgi:hypothetical protein
MVPIKFGHICGLDNIIKFAISYTDIAQADVYVNTSNFKYEVYFLR